MKFIFAMIIKDYKLLFRDKLSVFFVFFFPLIFISFFGSMYGSDASTPNVKIGTLDQDKTAVSQQFIADLDVLDSITVLPDLQDETVLQDALKHNDIAAILTLPKGFGKKYEEPFGDALTVSIITDPKEPATNMILTGMLKETASKRFNQLLDIDKMMQVAPSDFQAPLATLKAAMEKNNANADSSQDVNFTPITINEKPMQTGKSMPSSGFVFTLSQSAIWICMGVVVAFVSFIGVEATSGNLLRLSLSPFTKFDFLIAKGLGVFLAQLVLMTLFFTGTRLFVTFSPDVFGVIVCILCITFAFSGFMLGAMSLFDLQSKSVGSAVNSLLLILAMFGGAMIPLSFMPESMLAISKFNPIYHAIFALESVTWRGLSLAEIWLSLTVLITVGVAGLGISLVKFDYVQSR